MGIFGEILCYSNVNELQELLRNDDIYLCKSNGTSRKIPLAIYLKHNWLIFGKNVLIFFTLSLICLIIVHTQITDFFCNISAFAYRKLMKIA